MIINSGNLTLLYQGFNASFKEGFGQADSDYETLTLQVKSSTREEQYGWLGQFPGFTEWVGERTVRSIREHGYVIKNRKFESTVEVKRDDIEDDAYGVYSAMFAEMGRSAASHPAELVYATLKSGFDTKCYDGQYFFDTDHDVSGASVSNSGGGAGTPWYLLDCTRMIKPIIFQTRRPYDLKAMIDLNDEQVFMRDAFRYGVDTRVNAGFGLWQLAYGSKQALSADNYKAARQSMLGFKGDQDKAMGVRPTHLLVPPSLEGAAREILLAERNAAGATNVWQGSAKLLCSPWLA